jgi:hypothetical protein
MLIIKSLFSFCVEFEILVFFVGFQVMERKREHQHED